MKLRFVLAHALREGRSSTRRLGVYMLAITLGVAALVAVNSFRTNVVRSVQDEARILLGADLRIGSNRAFPDSVAALVDSVEAAGVRVARLTQLVSMALAPNERARLVQLRALSGGYPFYGEYETSPAGVWPPAGDDALIEPALRAHLDLAVGDTLRIGDARFVVRGTIDNLPPEAGFQTAIGPRVFIAGDRLAATNLLGFGSMARFHAYFEIASPRELERFVDRHHDFLRRHQVGYDTADEQAENLATALDALGRFLGLVGLAALLLGGVGVASAVNVFVREKRATIAVLRCLGATQRTAFTAYLMQAALLGIAGALFGALLGIALQWLIPLVVRDVLPVTVVTGVAWNAVFAGLGIGTAVATLFALLPLLEIRGISPLGVLRQPVESTRRRRFDAPRALTLLALLGLVVWLAVWQAGDRNAGLAFAAGLAGTLLLLRAAAWLLTKLTRRFTPRGATFTTRQGLAGLFRPYNQTAAVTLALGFGVFLIASLWIVQRNLLDWIALDDMRDQPNVVAFDIQREQRTDVDDILRAHGAASPDFVPIVPARVAAVDGVPRDTLLADPRARGIEPWTLRREYRHTYRAQLTPSETLVAGEWWDDAPAAADGVARVSLERDLARNLNVGVGSRITWTFQGVEIESVITSLRTVEWARFETNFFVVFEPGTIDDAPQMLVALARVGDDSARAALQGAIVRRHGNISVVDLASVQRTLAEIIGRVAVAIRFMAAFSVLAGVLVLAGAITAARFQRVRESVLLRALGATHGQVRRILLTEYLALGALAGLTGTLLGAIAAWGLISRLFQLDFSIHALDLLVIAALVALASAALGMANSREALRATPLAALRDAT